MQNQDHINSEWVATISLIELIEKFKAFSPQIILNQKTLSFEEVLANPIFNQKLMGIAPLDLAQKNQISFLTNIQYLKDISKTQALAVIINQTEYAAVSGVFEKEAVSDLILIQVPAHAYALFAKLQQYFNPSNLAKLAHLNTKQAANDIHSTAVIHPSVKLGQNIKVGAFSVIEENVSLGDYTQIGSHCHIAKNSQMANHVLLYPNVQIYADTKIGQNVIIHSGTVIGSDGFGFAPYFTAQEKAWLKIPQIGHVWIEDDVEIGANCSIDRAAFNYTKIGQGTKIDNLVQIAHNVEIGAYCVIAGCSAVAGSTKIGNFCIIGGSSKFAGHLVIADKTTISGGTSIMHSILESGQHYTGVYPALPHALWKRLAAYLRRLIKKKD